MPAASVDSRGRGSGYGCRVRRWVRRGVWFGGEADGTVVVVVVVVAGAVGSDWGVVRAASMIYAEWKYQWLNPHRRRCFA